MCDSCTHILYLAFSDEMPDEEKDAISNELNNFLIYHHFGGASNLTDMVWVRWLLSTEPGSKHVFHTTSRFAGEYVNKVTKKHILEKYGQRVSPLVLKVILS